jgi:hypothetical protein
MKESIVHVSNGSKFSIPWQILQEEGWNGTLSKIILTLKIAFK